MSALRLFPVIRISLFPPLFFASLGALLGVLITAFVLTQRAGQKNEELLKDYGETVVAMAAQELVDAAVNEDLVSMHALLQALIAQPRIVMATVHNLEQQLMVQAGQRQIDGQYQVYSAPIALHDTIAGHVSVTLVGGFADDSAVIWTLTGTAVLLLLMVVLSVYESRGVAWELRPPEVDDDHYEHDDFDSLGDSYASSVDEPQLGFHSEEEFEQPVQDSEQPEPEGEQEEVPTPSEFYSDLILVLPNYARLEKQLNGERFGQITQAFEAGLDDVLNLYSGQRVGQPHNNNVYCLRFSSPDSVAEAGFRAVCTAHLVDQMVQKHKVRFTVLAEICHPDEDVKLAMSQAGIFLQGLIVDDLLRKRLILQEREDGRLQLSGFNPPFAALLARQLDQLTQAVAEI